MASRPVIPERIRRLEPYRPGKPIEEVERELGLADTVKLASNESPLPPSAAVRAALVAAIDDVRLYPDGAAHSLTERLAARHSIARERVFIGNGSNEVLELVARLFASEGDKMVLSADAFVVYPLLAAVLGAEAVRVPARDFHHDLEAMAEAVDERTRIVFAANPNNPTGTMFDRGRWHAFLDRIPHDVVVVLDEAYHEFVDRDDAPDGVADLERHPGLVVTRTLSKAYGLAGLRIGYGMASAEIVDGLSRIRQPFNVNRLAQVAALAALDDEASLDALRTLVRDGRERLCAGFDALGLAFVPSQANFVLVDVGDGDAVTAALLARGVIVRPMGAYSMADKIRITVGTAAENERCLAALGEVMASR